MTEIQNRELDSHEDSFIEEVGTCSMSGYPLLAVHSVDGMHAGLALAHISETVRAKTRDDDGNPIPRMRVSDIASRAEILRSWSEVLLYALHERATENPTALDRDAERCRDLLDTAHHYDKHRIIAAVHLAAVEHLRMYQPWADPAILLLPDVSEQHTATTAQLAVRRLAGGEDGIPDAVDRIRGVYHQRLATAPI